MLKDPETEGLLDGHQDSVSIVSDATVTQAANPAKVVDDGETDLIQDYLISKQRKRRRRIWIFGTLTIIIIALALGLGLGLGLRRRRRYHEPPYSWQPPREANCQPALPPLLASNPPSASDLRWRLQNFDQSIRHLLEVPPWVFRHSPDGNPANPPRFDLEVDSLVVSIVTANGAVFEAGFGNLRANETVEGRRSPPNSNSIYRLGGVTQLFTSLETLLLRDAGVLNLDERVQKYIPRFSPANGGASQDSTTLWQLASHLSGLPKDIPVKLSSWPSKQDIEKRPRNLTADEILEHISNMPLVHSSSIQYPTSSNLAFDVLGMANVAADNLAHDSDDTKRSVEKVASHAGLVKRDIFSPLALSSSFYKAPSAFIAKRVAVPSVNSESADAVFGDAQDPSIGQYSSLSDLNTVVQTLLAKNEADGFLSPSSIDEWFKPQHALGGTLRSTSGAPWKIWQTPNYYNKDTVYTIESDDVPGYQASVSIIPELSFGVVVLRTGRVSSASGFHSPTSVRSVTEQAINSVRDEFVIRRQELLQRYAGRWSGGSANPGNWEAQDVVEVQLMDKSVLVVTQLRIQGVDILDKASSLFPDAQQSNTIYPWGTNAVLWSTGRDGEFRLAFMNDNYSPYSPYGDNCASSWTRLDPGYSANGSPIDLIYWKEGKLHYPSAGAVLERRGYGMPIPGHSPARPSSLPLQHIGPIRFMR